MGEIRIGNEVEICNALSKFFGEVGTVLANISDNTYLVELVGGLQLSFYKSELEVIDDSEDAVSLNVNSDEGPALFYLGTDGTLYRLDEGAYDTLPEDRPLIARDLLGTLISSYDSEEAKALLKTYSENDLLYLAYNFLQAIEISRTEEKENKVEEERLERKALKAYNVHNNSSYPTFYSSGLKNHWVKIVKAMESNDE